jgi:peptidoglycan LD-endopeptidase LytH
MGGVSCAKNDEDMAKRHEQRLRIGERIFEYKKRAKKFLKSTGIIALLFITAGLLPSSVMVVPVQSRMTCRKVAKPEQVQKTGACYWDAQSFWYYPWGESIVHKGIDIFAQEGDTVLAATYGVVIDKGHGTVSGNYVKILGPNWRIQYYAHMKKSNVGLLQFVHKGEKIGEVGNTGNAMGKPHHLHFSVTTILPHFWKIDDSIQGWKKSFYLNPEDFFAPAAE